MRSAFRNEDGSLDREYLRICGLYRLTRMRKLSAKSVKALATKPIRRLNKRVGWMDAVIESWFRGPFKAHND